MSRKFNEITNRGFYPYGCCFLDWATDSSKIIVQLLSLHKVALLASIIAVDFQRYFCPLKHLFVCNKTNDLRKHACIPFFLQPLTKMIIDGLDICANEANFGSTPPHHNH